MLSANGFEKLMPLLLLIEDEVEIIDDLTNLLAIRGFDVMSAQYGEEGLSKASEREPDIVLCDIQLPDIDGFQILSLFRNKYPSVPFVFLTGLTSDDNVNRGYELGANGYLKKPVAVHDLFSTLGEFFDSE
jgi:DNA-binding response OmpR family regulator